MLKTTCKAHMRPLPAKVFIFRENLPKANELFKMGLIQTPERICQTL